MKDTMVDIPLNRWNSSPIIPQTIKDGNTYAKMYSMLWTMYLYPLTEGNTALTAAFTPQGEASFPIPITVARIIARIARGEAHPR